MCDSCSFFPSLSLPRPLNHRFGASRAHRARTDRRTGGGHIISEVSVFSERDGIFGCGSCDFLFRRLSRGVTSASVSARRSNVVDAVRHTCHGIHGCKQNQVNQVSAPSTSPDVAVVNRHAEPTFVILLLLRRQSSCHEKEYLRIEHREGRVIIAASRRLRNCCR